MLDSIIQGIVEFVRQHQAWAVPLVFVLSFGESLAFISLLLPATVILFALSALLGEGGVAFVPVWMAAASGAFLGDWLSYWLGYRYQHQIGHVWPLSRNPHILQRGHRYFERWGFWGVFFGRFLGPLRAAVPLVAGICAMPLRYFQLANLLSALIWGAGILAPGMLGIRWLGQWMG